MPLKMQGNTKVFLISPCVADKKKYNLQVNKATRDSYGIGVLVSFIRMNRLSGNSKAMVMVVINNKVVKQTTNFLLKFLPPHYLDAQPTPSTISFITGEKKHIDSLCRYVLQLSRILLRGMMLTI